MKTRLGTVVLLCMLLAVMGLAVAAVPDDVRKQVETSMRVSGEISVDSNGKVKSFTLEDADALPPTVRAFVESSVPAWSFEPPRLDGKPVTFRNSMSILLVAQAIEGSKDYTMRIQATSFYPMDQDSAYEVKSRKLSPPRYPPAAARAGVMASVHLVAKIGRDGRVQDVVAEQTNLRVLARENVLEKLRGLFETSAISAARTWEFQPPTRGPAADAAFWSIRVPVDYSMGDGKSDPSTGRWISYVPGPRQTASWVEESGDSGSPEAMIAGVPQMLGGRGACQLRLLTPLGG